VRLPEEVVQHADEQVEIAHDPCADRMRSLKFPRRAAVARLGFFTDGHDITGAGPDCHERWLASGDIVALHLWQQVSRS
jgi:hypothetical protein